MTSRYVLYKSAFLLFAVILFLSFLAAGVKVISDSMARSTARSMIEAPQAQRLFTGYMQGDGDAITIEVYRVTLDGKECLVVSRHPGIGLSCNWNTRP